MKQEYIQTIRKACIEANSSILDLKFGCELQRPNSNRNYKVIEDIGWGANPDKVWINSVPFGSMELPIEIEKKKLVDKNGDEWKILGRPITISDVLISLRSNRKAPIGIDINGYFLDCDDNMENLEILEINWNLLKSLEDQEESTLEFIANILK